MSVLIKGVEPPLNCITCPCCNDDARFCIACGRHVSLTGKPPYCPMVEVPPHGRLIDADALLDELLPDPILECGCPDPEGIEEFCDWIDSAPTVIEGSKK